MNLHNLYRRIRGKKPICVLTDPPVGSWYIHQGKRSWWCIDQVVTDALEGAWLRDQVNDYLSKAYKMDWQYAGDWTGKQMYLARIKLAMQYVEVR